MTKQEIQQLLHRYMEGATTAAEEELLRQYFQKGDYAPEWAPYAMMFKTIDIGDSALSEKECTDVLNLCPAPPRSSFAMPQWWRYAAVWCFGLLLGGSGVWFSQGGLSGGVADEASLTAQTKPAKAADTVYCERIITQRDTVYIVRYVPETKPEPPATKPEQPARTETPPQKPAATPEAPWERNGNLAVLTVR